MKILGYLLLIAGFLGAAYFAVLDPESVPVGTFLPIFALGVIGVVLARGGRAQGVPRRRGGERQHRRHRNQSRADRREARDFDRDKESIDVYDLRHHIDREFPDDLDTFVQARQSIVHSYGLQTHADVMNPFAARRARPPRRQRRLR